MQEIPSEKKKQALEKMISEGTINQSLYKYRADDEYTEKIFTEKSLWFSHPSAFNDPFDCWANIQSFDKKSLTKALKQRNLNDKNKSRIIEAGMRSFTTLDLKKCIDSVLNQIGVCCFSKTFKSILMWSHYAHFHQGICLEFDILKDPNFFCFAMPVNYSNAMPKFNYPIDSDEIIKKVIQPKSAEWKYEEEIRIIKRQSDIECNGKQSFAFNPAALKKVIFGCKAHKTDIEKYKNLCKKNGFKHVTFTQMHQKANGSFELEEKAV